MTDEEKIIWVEYHKIMAEVIHNDTLDEKKRKELGKRLNSALDALSPMYNVEEKMK